MFYTAKEASFFNLIMTNPVRWLFGSLCTLFMTLFFGRFLGSEGTATSGRTLTLYALLLLFGICLFRLSALYLKKKFGFLVFLLMYLSILFLIAFFLYGLRGYALSLSLCVSPICSFFIFFVGSEQALSLPAPSGAASSPPWREDSFEMGVLLEPWPDEPGQIQRNLSYETSLRQRVLAFGNEESPWLMGQTPLAFLQEVENTLKGAPTQNEYNRLLEFEARDLLIREMKRSVSELFTTILSENPILAERAAYNPHESLRDFFDDKRTELDTHVEWTSLQKDQQELLLVTEIRNDLQAQGPNSIYIKRILGLE